MARSLSVLALGLALVVWRATTSIVAERLCGSIPMITWLISSPSYSIMLFLPSQEGTATSS
jgi:hypothetical protein